MSVCSCGKNCDACGQEAVSPPVWSRAGTARLFPTLQPPLPPCAGSKSSSAATGPSLTPSLTPSPAPLGTAAPTVAPWRVSPSASPLAVSQNQLIHTPLRSKPKSNSNSRECFVHLARVCRGPVWREGCQTGESVHRQRKHFQASQTTLDIQTWTQEQR